MSFNLHIMSTLGQVSFEMKNEMIGLFNVGLVTPGTFRRQERFSMNDMNDGEPEKFFILVLASSGNRTLDAGVVSRDHSHCTT